MLAFIGGLHWGLVLREPEAGPPVAPESKPAPGRHTRIGLAVLPLILGWVALLLPLVAAAWLALLLLIAAYIAVLVAEHTPRAGSCCRRAIYGCAGGSRLLRWRC